MPDILLIDDDADLCQLLSEDLVARGFTVDWLESAEGGPDRVGTGRFSLVLLDNKMPGMTGIDFLTVLKRRGIEIPVIVMTGESTPDTAIQATKLGAFDYVVKPGSVQELAAELDPVIRQALEITRPVKEVRVAPGKPPAADAGPVLVGGKNRRMLEVYKEIARIADSNVAVLILGETGTGKELVARALHTNSSRKARPFVALNCAALTETLLESELFGHEKGAHSTADKLRKGKFEYADGGTLFLDEIGDMSPATQVRVLRVLQEQELTRLGGNESIKIDVRVVSATHRDLGELIRDGRFRSDLHFRLNGSTLNLPPLRDRLDDLPELVAYFLGRAAEVACRAKPDVGRETLARLGAHKWPGNVRELQNVIFRALAVCRGSRILPGDLDFPRDGGQPAPPAGTEEEAAAGLQKAIKWAWNNHDVKPPWSQLQEMLLEELVRFAHKECREERTEIARRTGIGRTKLYELLEKYKLK